MYNKKKKENKFEKEKKRNNVKEKEHSLSKLLFNCNIEKQGSRFSMSALFLELISVLVNGIYF